MPSRAVGTLKWPGDIIYFSGPLRREALECDPNIHLEFLEGLQKSQNKPKLDQNLQTLKPSFK